MIKTFFDKPALADQGISGDGVLNSGTDPQVDTGGSGALQTLFDRPAVQNFEGSETPNSVSGLPATPNRFQESGEPPAPPSLEKRNPGTIDR